MTCISINFDDGYLIHYEYAKTLYRMDIPATFFIITGLNEYMGKKLIITRTELIKELIDMGHEVGSHTHTHRDLTTVSPSELREEFARSIETLMKVLRNGDGFGIAYPYGSFNENIANEASRYFIYGRVMGRFNRWNERPMRYAVGGMGVRHLVKYPLKVLVSKPRLIVVVFHDEPSWLIKLTIGYLKAFNVRFVTLREGLRCLGL
ncbi:polysaccharide deacetylase family protein [Vulcanisaeta distributa]|uniref:Polysaccharide deacetylase n=1 Tax=Vulcanisaeta distributa (strain DSM 14429 / JCM 11212 / NBRC 100878 / IC-017) TaxID=572478 RepID=E1QUE2_VULDI|nr:polysaccharide deacetylase family protein [Vulcanisaeta distributa]ADN49868.1 polysaccharide deacetylase [Vulcanisaeta distributa DSM 14429]